MLALFPTYDNVVFFSLRPFLVTAFANTLAVNKKYHHKINKICEPVREHLGIDYVTYHTVHFNGHCTIAVNRPEIDEYYIDNNLFVEDPFLRHPQYMQSGVMIWSEVFDPKNDREMYQAGAKFNLDLGFSLIERTENKVSMLGFATKKQKPNQLSHYINDLMLFKKFFHYFLNEAKPIISKLNDEPIELLAVIQDKFYETPLNSNIQLPNNIRQKFLLELTGQLWEPNFLTKREKDCLQALLKGYTAKLAAQELEISYRTVQHLIERLRHKLNCERKADLFIIAQKMSEIGIL